MKFQNCETAFDSLYDQVLKEGFDYAGTKALFGTHLTINDVEDHWTFPAYRKFNLKYALMEWDWYETGNRNADEISKVAKIWKSCQDEDGNVNSNYGYHWNQNRQLLRILQDIKSNPESRRGFISHFDYNKVHTYDKDTPCNIGLTLYQLNGKLNIHVFARSIDLVYGFCNDFFMFRLLLIQSAKLMGLQVGLMHYSITNLHIYPRHFDLKSKWTQNNSKKGLSGTTGPP